MLACPRRGACVWLVPDGVPSGTPKITQGESSLKLISQIIPFKNILSEKRQPIIAFYLVKLFGRLEFFRYTVGASEVASGWGRITANNVAPIPLCKTGASDPVLVTIWKAFSACHIVTRT